MNKHLPEIRKTLELIDIIESKYKIKPNHDVDDPLLYCGVADSNLIQQLSEEVEKFFGKAYKPAGEGAFFKNFFDRFIREVGGARKDQTLFRKEISESVVMYCAFWPWGSNPIKTSVRIGLVCYGADERDFFTRELKGEF
ncbi:MAG TPA: hypothetical protein PLM07_20260 [Candidatus Rifleibacterium sp.]|nr:hypothetical protein [Candidatus Rifleibacterium sp.]HPT48222.1 hypothetical protein [Candidatus Rifleibacterium sp.]